MGTQVQLCRFGRVSGLNADPRITRIVRQAFAWAQVHCLVENVASMDYDDCLTMNDAYECEPLVH